MQEEWRDVLGYEGLYQVSNLGNVKSLNYNKTSNEKVLKQDVAKHKNKTRNYNPRCVRLCKNGKSKKHLVSRLVYTAFRGQIPSVYQIDHINNNPEDNRLENLQLLTPSENIKKCYVDDPQLKYRHGRKARSIRCLNNDKVYRSIADASRELNLVRQNINNVFKGKRKHTGDYKFQYVN